MKYDLKNEKIAVHCQTSEEAKKVVHKMLKSGIELQDDVSKNETIGFFKLGSAFFFSDYQCKIDSWEDREAAMEQGYKIIPASEYLSQFEEVPKYGDKVWGRDSEEDEWDKDSFIFACFIDEVCCVFLNEDEKHDFENKGCQFSLIKFNHYRTTDPAKDLPTLSLQEIADLKGVSIEQAKEMINKLK